MRLREGRVTKHDQEQRAIRSSTRCPSAIIASPVPVLCVCQEAETASNAVSSRVPTAQFGLMRPAFARLFDVLRERSRASCIRRQARFQVSRTRIPLPLATTERNMSYPGTAHWTWLYSCCVCEERKGRVCIAWEEGSPYTLALLLIHYNHQPCPNLSSTEAVSPPTRDGSPVSLPAQRHPTPSSPDPVTRRSSSGSSPATRAATVTQRRSSRVTPTSSLMSSSPPTVSSP